MRLLLLLALLAAGCSETAPVQLTAEQVEARALEILPGAAPVGGLKGVLYLDAEDAEIAVLAPGLAQLSPSGLSGGELRIVVGRLKVQRGDEEGIERIRTLVEQQRERKAEKMTQLSQEWQPVKVRGRPRPVRVTRYQLVSDGRQLLQWTCPLPRPEGLAVVLVLGPADTFNAELARSFLEGLEPPARRRRP